MSYSGIAGAESFAALNPVGVAPGSTMVDPDPELSHLGRKRLTDAFDAPLRCVVEPEAWIRYLTASRRHLKESASCLGPQVRQGRPNDFDRTNQVRFEYLADLFTGWFLDRGEQGVAGVVDYDVDRAELYEASSTTRWTEAA
jgi:hypothetical protein